MKKITANIKLRKYNSLFISSDVGLVHKTRKPASQWMTQKPELQPGQRHAPTLSPPMLGWSMWLPLLPGPCPGSGCRPLQMCQVQSWREDSVPVSQAPEVSDLMRQN